jgi:hypothetical protein
VQEKHVLSWDEEEKWCIGCQVLVARNIKSKYGFENEIVPFIGTVVDIRDRMFYIQINSGIVKFGQVESGSDDAKKYYENVRQSIWVRENKQREQSGRANIEEQENIVLLKHGAHIASRIRDVLESDHRFASLSHRWYLQKWIPEISRDELKKAHRQILKASQQTTLLQLSEQIQGIPDGDIGEISLIQALSKTPDLFQPSEDGWQAVPIPLPTWQQAIVTHYAYDPNSYEILCRPGQRLSQKQAHRLQELELYPHVVTSAE